MQTEKMNIILAGFIVYTIKVSVRTTEENENKDLHEFEL